jgi:undecaprenyl-diphosphatase
MIPTPSEATADAMPGTARRTGPADTVAPARSARRVNGILRPSRHPVPVVIIAVLGALLVTVVGFLLRSHSIDLRLAEALNTLHTGVVGQITSMVYRGLEPISAIAITVLTTAVIWLSTRQLRVAAAFAGVVAITWIPSDVVKILVARPRPDAALMTNPFSPVQPDASFPSGHTVFITVFVIALVFVLRGTRWMPVGVVFGTVLVLGVAFSVTVDAVHYPTDALASILWSVTVAPGVRVVWVDWLMPRIPGLSGGRH